jgi:hypothetical protein
MSNCSICYDSITATTGSCTLSCSHIYHLKCIATWIITHPTCPCCRKAINEYEKIGINDNDDTLTYNTDDTLDEFMDDTIGSWVRTPTGRWVLDTVPILQLPTQFQPMTNEVIVNTIILSKEHFAVIKIQAAVRGFLIRKLHTRIR